MLTASDRPGAVKGGPQALRSEPLTARTDLEPCSARERGSLVPRRPLPTEKPEEPNGKTFRQAAEQFEREYEIITEGERSPEYVESHKSRLRAHLLPYFGDMYVEGITPGDVQDYRIHRATTSKTGKPPARNTLHQEIVTLRHVLKTAHRHGWIQFVPDLSAPYKTSGKVAHRAWFSPKECKRSVTTVLTRRG